MYSFSSITPKRVIFRYILAIGNEKAFLQHKVSPDFQKLCSLSPCTYVNRISGLFHLRLGFVHSSRWTVDDVFHRGFTSQSRPRFSPQEEHHLTILERLQTLENKVRIYGYSTIRWGLGILILLGVGVYIFRESLRENVADEVAGVASRSLGDENLVLKANEVTKIVLKDILNDPATMELVSSFVLSILSTEMVTKGALELTASVLQNPETQTQINTLCQQTLKHLLSNEEMMNLLLVTIKGLIENDQTRESCKALLRSLSKDEAIKNFMATFFSDVIASSVVKETAVALSKDVTQEVVGDEHIQEETGNAMWNAFVHSVTPSWLTSTKD